MLICITFSKLDRFCNDCCVFMIRSSAFYKRTFLNLFFFKLLGQAKIGQVV